MVRPLLVTDYLRTHSFRQLEEEHGVNARPSTDESKVSLNYDQIMVKSGDRLAEQCRGLVVRPLQWDWAAVRDDWKSPVVGEVAVVAWPMERFYNHGDAAGADIDWSDPGLRVYEKLDGTMIVLYFDHVKEAWHAGTRAVCEADLPMGDQLGMPTGTTFSMLFWTALDHVLASAVATHFPEMGSPTTRWDAATTHDTLIDGFLAELDPHLTYVFELTSPYNRVVVRYDEPCVTLLAIRDTTTGQELDIADGHVPYSIPRPKTWPLHDASALAAFVDAADPVALEGAVVCSSGFERLKVKNKQWVVASRAKDTVSTSRRSALEAVIRGTIDDVMPLLDDGARQRMQALIDGYRAWCLRTDVSFAQWRDEAAGSRKSFAGFVCVTDAFTPVFFALWEGKASTTHEWMMSAAERGKLSPTSLDSILARLV